MSGGVSLGAAKVCAIYRTIWGEEAHHPVKDPKSIHCKILPSPDLESISPLTPSSPKPTSSIHIHASSLQNIFIYPASNLRHVSITSDTDEHGLPFTSRRCQNIRLSLPVKNANMQLIIQSLPCNSNKIMYNVINPRRTSNPPLPLPVFLKCNTLCSGMSIPQNHIKLRQFQHSPEQASLLSEDGHTTLIS